MDNGINQQQAEWTLFFSDKEPLTRTVCLPLTGTIVRFSYKLCTIGG